MRNHLHPRLPSCDSPRRRTLAPAPAPCPALAQTPPNTRCEEPRPSPCLVSVGRRHAEGSACSSSTMAAARPCACTSTSPCPCSNTAEHPLRGVAPVAVPRLRRTPPRRRVRLLLFNDGRSTPKPTPALARTSRSPHAGKSRFLIHCLCLFERFRPLASRSPVDRSGYKFLRP